MKKRIFSLFLTLCLGIGLFPASAFAANTQTVKVALTVDYDAAEEALELLNQLRREAGVQELVMDRNMLEMAVKRASECAVRHDHTRPNGLYFDTARPSASRYQDCYVSENIYYASSKSSPERATQVWYDSPPHCANMLNGEFCSAGIACVYDQTGQSFWVQTFATVSADVDPNPLTGTSNLTFSVEAAPDAITPHVENNSVTLQMNAPQDIMVYNDKSPLVPDILQSGDESVVTLSYADTAVRLTAVGPGSTTVNLGFGGKTVSLQVSVPSYNPLEEIRLTEPAGGFNLKVGESLTTEVNFLPAGSTSCPVSWSTNMDSRISIEQNGSSCKVTAKSPGSVELIATVIHPNTGVRLQARAYIIIKKADVVVEPPIEEQPEEERWLELSDSRLSLTQGDYVQLTAKVYPSGSSQKVTWDTSDDWVVTVDSQGHVNAVGAGSAVVTATTADGALSASCQVTVARKVIAQHTFSDVSEDDYFYDAVMWCADQGLVTGTGGALGDTFHSSRLEMVQYLWLMAGSPRMNLDNMPYTDMKDRTEGIQSAVMWAVENGITNGTSATTFSPDGKLTRAEVVTFLYRLADCPQVPGSAGFSDVSSNSWFADPAVWAVKEGITNGTSATTFTPDRLCVRPEVLTFIYRYYN